MSQAVGNYKSKALFVTREPIERIARGLMHERGLGGPFNYTLSCAWAHKEFNPERNKRVRQLADFGFDRMLNSVKSELLVLDARIYAERFNDPESIQNKKEHDAAQTLLDTLTKAANTYNSGTGDILEDQKTFQKTVLDAVNIASPILSTKKNWVTILAKIASAVVSVASFGLAPYVLGKSTLGLFSARVDVVENLDALAQNFKK